MALGKTAKYYKTHPAARKVKAATDAKVNRKPAQVKKRVESNQKRREAEKRGQDIRGKDYDHAVNRFVKSATNRGRKNEGGRKRGPNKRKGPK